MAAAVKPVFTIAQSQAVRLAIKERLEWEETPSSEARALTNALRQLDVAERETRRRSKIRTARIALGDG